MDREQIKTFLPHREPMLLVDSITLSEAGDALGQYTVRGDEWFLQGHFPQRAVVPGVILCEMLAQSACLLVADDLKKGLLPLFAGMDGVRLRRQVIPGETVSMHCRPLRRMGNLVKVQGTARVGGEVAAQGVFLVMLSQ